MALLIVNITHAGVLLHVWLKGIKMKYYLIAAATLIICGVAGVSTSHSTDVAENEKITEDQENIIPVEYIDFDPLYITADLGKNEG